MHPVPGRLRAYGRCMTTFQVPQRMNFSTVAPSIGTTSVLWTGAALTALALVVVGGARRTAVGRA